jgi:hypothetical protein
MTHFIHHNIKVNKTFQELLKNNNKNKILDFIDKYTNILLFNKNIFNLACSHCNLEIVKLIFEKLHNKLINFKNGLFNCIHQNNEELFEWLNSKYKTNDFYIFLRYCIVINQEKFFKYLHHLNHIDLHKNNNELFKLSLKKGCLEITHYILENIHISLNYFDLPYFEIACNSNNAELITFLNSKYNFLETFQDNQKTKLFIFNLCKNGYMNTFKKLNNESMILHDIIKKNIYNIIYYVISSNDYEFTEYILSLRYHNEINIPFLFEKAIILGNLKIIKLLVSYQPNIIFNVYNQINNILNKNKFKIFIFILQQHLKTKFSLGEKICVEKNINFNYLKILMNLNTRELHLFYSFIQYHSIEIYSNQCYLNKLLCYKQLNKLNLIEKYFPLFFHLDLKNIFKDGLESNNERIINYCLEKLKNINIDENTYTQKILEYSYHEGLYNLIQKYDINNNYNIKNYNAVFIKNILKNNVEIIERLLSKKLKQNNIELENNFHYIITTGNSKLYDIIKEKFSYFKISKKHIIHLIKDGNFHLFKKIIVDFNKNELDENKEEYLVHISKCGNPYFIEWYFSYFEDNMINHNIENCFYLLIKLGHFSQALNIYNKFKNNDLFEIDLYKKNFELLLFVIKQDNLEMTKWFFENMDVQNKIKFSINFEYHHYILNITENDNVNILDYIFKLYKIDDKIIIRKSIGITLRKNKPQCLTYLFKIYDIKENSLNLNIKEYFLHALKYCNYDLIDLIVKENREYNWLFVCALSDQYLFFHYLIREYKEYIIMNEELFYNLCFEGKLEETKILLHYYREIDFSKITAEHLSILVSYNDLEMIEYLIQLNKDIDFNFNNCYLLRLAILLNNEIIIDWVLKNILNLDLHIENNFIFKTVIYNQNLSLLKKLYIYSNKIDFKEMNNYYLKLSSQLESHHIFIWLLETIDDNIDIHQYNDIYIKNAIDFNNIQLVDYLLYHDDFKEFNINFNEGYIIKKCFGYHYVELIKYLFDRFKNIDVLIQNEVIMQYAVEDGDLELIELLYDYCSNFNLSKNNEYLFRTACKMDKVEIAKWLISKKPTINYSLNNHEIFYFVCEQEYVEIAKYLAELDTLYELNIQDNVIISYSIKKNLIIQNILKKVDNIENCPICFDHSELITNCNHQFCIDCLENVNNKNIDLVCPLCRCKVDLIYKVEKKK